ncbi:hypothetical protein ACQKFG_15295 [Peribacillus sp. NPDC076916]|uniref:hypothetical protein n=1 Tax=Peribacillus sp. NPDC076916 TaxID=3390608 RepID=UPI003D05036E
MKINLTIEQEQMKEIVKVCVKKLQDHYSDIERLNSSEVDKTYREMADAAHELHMQLEPKPKLTKAVIKNSDMSPEDPEFYYHLHPSEDLLAYLEDSTANDDNPDISMGNTFKFKVFSNRWGHHDDYSIVRNEEGWKISFNAYDIQGDTEATPALKTVLGHDFISYPEDIGSYFHSVWVKAEEGLSVEEVQQMLNEIAEWISETEKNSPKHLLI